MVEFIHSPPPPTPICSPKKRNNSSNTCARGSAKKAMPRSAPSRLSTRLFSKSGFLGQPYVIAFVDTAHVSNTPTEILQNTEGWFRQLIGHQGAACIVFLYHGAPAITTVEEIQKIGAISPPALTICAPGSTG